MQRDRLPLSEQHRGNWRGILAGLGIPDAALVNRHGPCPICGGKDRFRFDDKDGHGTFICSHCGAGDGPKLAMLFLGIDFRALADKLDGGKAGANVGGAAMLATPQLHEETPPAKRARMNSLWRTASEVTAIDLAGRYLTSRLRSFPEATGLRFQPRCSYPQGDQHAAMLAMFTGPDGKPSALHRTYLSPEGRKAALVSPKLSLGPLIDGGAVRLAAAGDTLGIAEGIETALAASKLFGVPCWAALNANRLAVWSPPPGVRKVMIFADNDENFVGQTAAFDLAARLDGRCEVVIETPINEGTDWADLAA